MTIRTQEITRRLSGPARIMIGRWRLAFLCVILAVTASLAQDEQPSTSPVKFTTLVNFDGANGSGPDVKPLIQGAAISTVPPRTEGLTLPAPYSE